MSDETEIKAKVQYFESLASDIDSMAGEQRARLRKEMVEFYDQLDTSKRIAKYAAGGALVAGILPGIGWILGGTIGAVVGALKCSDVETNARDRMGKLIENIG